MNFNSRALINLISQIPDLQMFALCKQFDELSLNDNTGVGSSFSSSSSSTTQVPPYNRGTLHNFLQGLSHSLWNKSLIEQLQAPFIEFPQPFIDSFKSHAIRMAFGYRFYPGHADFILEEFHLPESFERLCFLSNSLGLSYNSVALSIDSILPYSYAGAGIRSLVSDGFTKVLVEVVSIYDGMFGRFLVLVCLGVGSSVWYKFAPGTVDNPPISSGLFEVLESYHPYFNPEYNSSLFHKIAFVEKNETSPIVESAFVNERPFAEIKIPASGPMLKAVGLGVMIAFFLSVGMVPNISGDN